MPVRALQRVATVASATAPYNTIQLKLFYPALDATTEEHYQTGVLPFDTQFSPAPVVIFLPGVNCSAHTYEWLATNLAENGIVTVIASWLAQNLPGRFSISPGIDLDAVHVDNYGTRPTSSSLQTIIDALKTLSSETVLAGNAARPYRSSVRTPRRGLNRRAVGVPRNPGTRLNQFAVRTITVV